MADDAPKVVILDAAGTRHVFPAGFDPVKAAAIVRQQSNPAPATPSAAEMMSMGPRTAGGYTTAEEGAPESTASQAIRGMIHPTPGQQAAMDVLPIAGAMAEAAPNAVVRAGQAVKSGAQQTADALMAAAGSKAGAKVLKYGGTATGAAMGGPVGAILGSQVGEDLASRLRMRSTPTPAPDTPPAGVDRYMPNVSGTTAPPDLALANTQRSGNMTWNMGGQTPTELSYEAIEDAAQGASRASQKSPQQLANEEALARRRAAYAASQQQPVPLKQAVNAVQKMAATNDVKLTAEEFDRAVTLRAAGKSEAEILDGITAMRQLKGMPGVLSPEEVNADMQQRAMSGQKSLMAKYGPKSAKRFEPSDVNPFR